MATSRKEGLRRKHPSTEGTTEVLPNTQLGNFSETPAIPMEDLRNPKQKRGPTKLKTIAVDGGSRLEVKFNENGQPIGDESVKLSSFLGPLVREIIPVTIPDWRKVPLGMMEVLWKTIQVLLTCVI